MRRRGFTLIEVLVVVAIIALLIAILLPSLKKVRERGRAAVCLSNMRQLGVAVMMYTQTNNGALPDFGLAHGGTVDWETSWVNTLSREFGRNARDAGIDSGALRCPEDGSPYWDASISETDQVRRTSYGVNDYITGRVAGYAYYSRIDRLKRPVSTILFAELAETTDYAVSDHVHASNWVLNPRVEAREQVAIERHGRKAHYTFADGHVAPHVFEETYSIASKRREGRKFVVEWHHNKYDPTVAH